MQRQRKPLAGALSLVALTVVFAAQQRHSTPRTNSKPKPTPVSATAPTSSSPSLAEQRRPACRHRARHAFPVSVSSSRCNTASRTSAPTSKTSSASTRTRSSRTRSCRTGSSKAEPRTSYSRDSPPHRARFSSARRHVTDYQLHPGDTINLRLLDERTRELIPVPFTYAGIALEFPTAPKDSFFVANAGYVASATGSPTVGTFLIQTGQASPERVAARVAARLGTSARVTDITSVRRDVSGSITSVELTGLLRVELGFALVLASAATGLLLWAGLSEQRRTFAIAQALGATPRQLGSFIWTETVFVTTAGLLLGAAGATTLTLMLIKLLTGVFDPPPTSPVVPWAYLAAFTAVAAIAVVAASLSTIASVRHPAATVLRDL